MNDFIKWQNGFKIKTTVNCSIRRLLCDHLGISPAYLEERIKTIFLDGKPVDDLDTAIVKNGSTLALSAAMPGLVGATMRRGGVLASFRNTITHEKESQTSDEEKGTVCIKLFNMLINELMPHFLHLGVIEEPV